jgi:hypothetical protein
MAGPGRPRKEDVTFAEAQGTEANQHAKKLAKEKASKKKEKHPVVYSQAGSKVISVCVKPHGTHRQYVGSLLKKKEAGALKTSIAQWKKDGLWVEQHALEQYAEAKIKELTTKEQE